MASFKGINKFVSKSVRSLYAKRRENGRFADNPGEFIESRLRRVNANVDRAVGNSLPVIKGPGGGIPFARFAMFVLALLFVTSPALAASTVEVFGCGRSLGKYTSAGIVHKLEGGAVKFIDKHTGKPVVLVGDIRVSTLK